MVVMSTLMNLKYFAKGLWQHFIWMKRSRTLMFNHCLPVSRPKSPSLASRSLKDFKNKKILCRVCFEEQINIVLLPCRHHGLCRYSYLSIPINIAKVRSFWLSRALSVMINALVYLLNLWLRHHNFSCMYVYGNYLQNCNLCLMTMHNITFIIKGCGIVHSFLSD
ncbi:hypothetical protein ES288_A13G158300v1 [Gossypium darwinii]|uniref:Uncharacterized protein n=1 Tax=Gossypium darwinii TaxID=34276 RepID=A0A5D2DZY9_GOSDA|nr:hypothetical protein ES288_A13G158300v1 [Gossypium darwinii]